MGLFDGPRKIGKSQDKLTIKKAKSTKKTTITVKTGGDNVLELISKIKAMVEKNLGKFQDKYIVIRDEQSLQEYLNACIANNVISIDTETTGLDPLQDKCVGICIYTPDQKPAYIPMNHISYVTGIRVDNQLNEKQITSLFEPVISKHIDIIMFNAKFDIRVLRAVGIKDIYCTWDGYLAGRILNENEPEGGLKALHQKYVLDGKEDEFSFGSLFKGITFDKIPINTAYLYAAHDAVITYELYEYQKKFLYYEKDQTPESRNGMNGASWVFLNIEMPCISVVADMEDTGVKVDLDYQKQLSEKYNKLLDEAENKFYRVCDEFGDKLDAYREKMGSANKLEYPINIRSSQQIAIMIYDVLEIKPVDKQKPRGTGEDILKRIDHPIVKELLKYREISKLLSTYIDKLNECVNPNDGRIHCSFNQYGADTGRFSSSDPNLQNIPSHNKDIRKMFVASNGEEIIDTDTEQFEVERWCEVECVDEWKYADKLVAGDKMKGVQNTILTVKNVQILPSKVLIDFVQ